jgi:hypothetical protein
MTGDTLPAAAPCKPATMSWKPVHNDRISHSPLSGDAQTISQAGGRRGRR